MRDITCTLRSISILHPPIFYFSLFRMTIKWAQFSNTHHPYKGPNIGGATRGGGGACTLKEPYYWFIYFPIHVKGALHIVLIGCMLFYSLLENIAFIWRCHHVIIDWMWLVKGPFRRYYTYNYGDVIFVSEGLKNWTQFYFGLLQIKFIVLFFNAMNWSITAVWMAGIR